jgi:hypothetical protein
MFSDRVQYLAEILGNLAWVILGLIVAAILGWKVLKYFSPRAESDEQVGPIGPIGPLPVTTDD